MFMQEEAMITKLKYLFTGKQLVQIFTSADTHMPHQIGKLVPQKS